VQWNLLGQVGDTPGVGVLIGRLVGNRGWGWIVLGDLNPKFLGLPHECPMSQFYISATKEITVTY